MSNCCPPAMLPEWVGEHIERVINQKILCNEIQAGLLDCGSNVMAGGTHVVRCDELSKLVDDAITSGEVAIPGIESLEFDGERITLIDQAGTSHQIDISSLADKTVASYSFDGKGTLTITLKDGTTQSADISEYVSATARLNRVLEGHADESLNVILTLADGEQVKINLGDQFKAMNDLQVSVLKEIMALNKQATLDALANAAAQNKITDIALDKDKNIVITTGDGEKVVLETADLRKIDIGRDSPFEFDENGNLIFNPERIAWKVIDEVSFDEEGLHIKLDNQCDEVVVSLEDFLKVLSGKVTVSVCDQGVLTGDGTEKNPLCIDIAKLIELLTNGTDAMDKLLKILIDAIQRVSEPCTVSMETVSDGYTLLNEDNVLLSTGGVLAVNTASAEKGRQFTIVQTTDKPVTITPIGVTVVPPYLGTLVTAGVNAVVTLMCEDKGKFRLFGQTKEA